MRCCFPVCTRVKAGEKVLDLGTGTGIIPILLAGKTKAGHLTGLEIQEESADMARRSVLYNQLEDRVSIVEGDIKEAGQLFDLASFDVSHLQSALYDRKSRFDQSGASESHCPP